MSVSRTILDLCGGTGSWAKPYKDAGYNVITVDVLDGQDVRLLTRVPAVHGILAAPPCTHFSSSGARWWKDKGEAALLEGLAVVDACMRIIWAHRPKWYAIENPQGRLVHYLGPPAMKFQPCDYGDPYTKLTYLWGDFTPPIKMPVEPTEGSKMHTLPATKDRWRKRSQTPPGFAKAFFEANP